ncbi:MAG: glycosyltransferase [Nitrospinae bacterium]|nr:glycosyltransferase [Nitrospinota bacterium]
MIMETGMSGRNSVCEITISKAALEDHEVGRLIDPSAGSRLDLTAFVSCYNESEYIAHTLDAITSALGQVGITYEIIVIDDNSSDDSAGIVREYIDSHPDKKMILKRNLVNKGLAQNYIDAAFLGKGKYYRLFCGDNPEPIESIISICSLIGKADTIIPNHASVPGKGAFRKRLSRLYTQLVNMVSGHYITYYNGLAIHLRHNVMRWHPNTRGFGFQADILCMLLDSGASYIEVSVPAINRAPSRSLTMKNFLSVGHTLLDIMIRRIANRVYRRNA